MEEPLIHTAKGNLLISSLRHGVEWKYTEDQQVTFIESYYLDDELVKQSSHVYILTGATALGEANI